MSHPQENSPRPKFSEVIMPLEEVMDLLEKRTVQYMTAAVVKSPKDNESSTSSGSAHQGSSSTL